ncbi:MAG: ABC transporter ATP-binding protein [Gammaproteobacteria bacterium]|nr:MAG: ABC transporter ATP-binding protein [Gammaproteobacteria bacterium]
MACVTYKNISKTFDDGTRALTDFDLHINDGELMVLVGPSGCGKSTALRLLAGLEPASSGQLLIDNIVVNDVLPQKRNIAMVFQNYALYPHMTVQRNLEFPLRMIKMPADEMAKRTQWVAELLQLDNLMTRAPKQLSGGQRQRVAMGRAIVREPSVFLMDEPLSNLDAKLRVQIRSEIASLQQRLDITTLYVTHDQVEAMTLGDRVAVINTGCLQQVDVPQVLYERPANTFVAQFVGSPGMNIFASRLKKHDTGLAFKLADQWLPVPDTGRVNHNRAYIDQDVFIGLRPECMTPADSEKADVSFKLKAVEALGHEQLLYFDINMATGSNLIARFAGTDNYVVGDEFPLQIDFRELYFFNQQGTAIY